MAKLSNNAAVELLATLGISGAPVRAKSQYAKKIVPLTPDVQRVLEAVEVARLSKGQESIIPHTLIAPEYIPAAKAWLVTRGYGTPDKPGTIRNYRNAGKQAGKATAIIVEPVNRVNGWESRKANAAEALAVVTGSKS